VKVAGLHRWQVDYTEAVEIQRQLAQQVSRTNQVYHPGLIAGVDISTSKTANTATAAVVVLHNPGMQLAEARVVTGELTFPYIPGLLSFRESPLILAACQQLSLTPDVIIVDGQGIAHPRRLDLTSHLGLLLDTPTIGCAKSRLCGSHGTPGDEPGSHAIMMDSGEIIGAVLRTRRNVKPVYVSIGHQVNLDAAIHWILECGGGYRLPEPTRLAHLAAGGNLQPPGKTGGYHAVIS